MREARRYLNRAVLQPLICWAAAQYVRLVWYSGRWRREDEDAPSNFFEQGNPIIVAAWHGRLFMMPKGWKHSNRIHVLISAHRDGQLLSRTMAHFGMTTVPGSTRRGGAEALLRLRRILRDGGAVGITPDGPRGPRMRASTGIIHLARLTGAPIFPLTYSCSKRRIVNSWDRLLLPLPFARGVFLWGEAIHVPADADEETIEAIRRDMEEKMTELTHRADTMMGQRRIDPAPIEEVQEA